MLPFKKILYCTLCLIASNTYATVFTVNSTANTNTGSGNNGTLYYCITQANLTAGPHTIQFSVSGTISISTNAVGLPALSQAISIDGSTAPGYSGLPVIRIDGTGSTSVNGLRISAANGSLLGLEVINFPYVGIVVTSDAADNFTIGANGKPMIVANNSYYGIQITGGDFGKIEYCKVGVSAGGSACNGNDYHGIYLESNANSDTIRYNHVSCNGYNGLCITNSDYNIVKGNVFGPLTGTCANNGYRGIKIESGSNNNVIGGQQPNEGNKIAGNLYWGVEVTGNTSIYNIISGNSMSCNDYGGIELSSSGNALFAAPVISVANATTVSGTSTANAIIEIFRDQNTTSCAFTPTNNQGADFLGTTTANASGNWTFSGTFNGYIVATARDAGNGNTSEFSARVNTGVAATVQNPCAGIIILDQSIKEFKIECYNESYVRATLLSEPNSSSIYHLESSLDGEEFYEIGIMLSDATVEEKKYRLFELNKEKYGKYYRISSQTEDGKTTYSKTLYFDEAVCVFNKDLEIFPNPFAGNFTVKIKKSDRQNILKILDMMGNVVIEKAMFSESEIIHMENFAQGIYQLSLTDENGVILVNRKIIKSD